VSTAAPSAAPASSRCDRRRAWRTLHRRLALACAAAVMVFMSAAFNGGYRIWVNLSPSMPVGLYLSRKVVGDQVALPRGTIVAVCLPHSLAAWGRGRGYLVHGRCRDGIAPVGKPVFAVAGDTVGVGWNGLARNGTAVAATHPLLRDRAGRSLPRLPYGTYPVEAGQLWLVSTHVAASWDSRYYGPVPAADVVAVLRPVWVIDTASGSSTTKRFAVP
jgi:conjugative transfer signal peptidase TraF